MAYNPFLNVRISGTWEDHASYSLGGTDLPLAAGTVIPRPASGTLRTSGGSGEWQAGWVGSAGRRSILSLDTPLYRHSPRRYSPFEAEGPMVAVVIQHQSTFAAQGWAPQGVAMGWSGASANGVNYGGDVHLHWHGLDASGNRLRIESFLPASATAGNGGYIPIPIEEDDMYDAAARYEVITSIQAAIQEVRNLAAKQSMPVYELVIVPGDPQVWFVVDRVQRIRVKDEATLKDYQYFISKKARQDPTVKSIGNLDAFGVEVASVAP